MCPPCPSPNATSCTPQNQWTISRVTKIHSTTCPLHDPGNELQPFEISSRMSRNHPAHFLLMNLEKLHQSLWSVNRRLRLLLKDIVACHLKLRARLYRRPRENFRWINLRHFRRENHLRTYDKQPLHYRLEHWKKISTPGGEDFLS